MKKETSEEALIRLFDDAGVKIVDCTARKQLEEGKFLPKKRENKKLK